MRVVDIHFTESSSVFYRDGVLQWSGLAPRLAHLSLDTYAQGQESTIPRRIGRRYDPHHFPLQNEEGLTERLFQVLRYLP